MSLNSADNKEVEFDNFDRYIEIVSRKDTLHNIFGIAYETSSSATQESANFQKDDDQGVEASTHVDQESLVVISDFSE